MHRVLDAEETTHTAAVQGKQIEAGALASLHILPMQCTWYVRWRVGRQGGRYTQGWQLLLSTCAWFCLACACDESGHLLSDLSMERMEGLQHFWMVVTRMLGVVRNRGKPSSIDCVRMWPYSPGETGVGDLDFVTEHISSLTCHVVPTQIQGSGSEDEQIRSSSALQDLVF